jgi:hypothetical protein
MDRGYKSIGIERSAEEDKYGCIQVHTCEDTCCYRDLKGAYFCEYLGYPLVPVSSSKYKIICLRGRKDEN